jgi:hypothetical protein
MRAIGSFFVSHPHGIIYIMAAWLMPLYLQQY